MRFKELLEYKRDITANNFGEKLLTLALNDQSFIRILQTEFPQAIDSNYREIEGWFDNWIQENSDKVIDFALKSIENKDPSPNKQYTQWIVMRYLDKTIKRFEDILTTVETLLRKYHELKVRRALPAELADIGKFKTATDFHKLWTSVNSHYEELEKKLDIQQKEALPKGNAKVVLDNKEVRVIIPQDKQAACYYGQGTQWCTASTSSTNYFDHYNNDGPLFVLIPKDPNYDGEKYQLHFETGQYMDESDSPINLQRLFTDRFTDPSTFEFFDGHGSLSSMIPFANDQVFEDIVKAVKEQVNEYLWEQMTEWEAGDDYYYEWLSDNGHVNKDGDIKDSAPSYFDYNPEVETLCNNVLADVDISKNDVSYWNEQWEDNEIYELKDLIYVISSILRAGEERGSGFRGDIADSIEKGLSLDVTQSDDPKMPAGWTLYHEWQTVVDGRTKWNKSKVAEKNYVN